MTPVPKTDPRFQQPAQLVSTTEAVRDRSACTGRGPPEDALCAAADRFVSAHRHAIQRLAQ